MTSRDRKRVGGAHQWRLCCLRTVGNYFSLYMNSLAQKLTEKTCFL